jgi:hypothetical protein
MVTTAYFMIQRSLHYKKFQEEFRICSLVPSIRRFFLRNLRGIKLLYQELHWNLKTIHDKLLLQKLVEDCQFLKFNNNTIPGNTNTRQKETQFLNYFKYVLEFKDKFPLPKELPFKY